jgi:4-hydroxy-tetrahydrodipicolinate reductase
MAIKICVAGATGWAGSAIIRRILDSSEFELVGAIARQKVGMDLGEALGQKQVGLKIVRSFAETLAASPQVLIDYTGPESIKSRALAALEAGVRVVIGTSGLNEADYNEIELKAQEQHLGVIAAGNFSITAALAKHFAVLAARYLPSWEIIDYASAGKKDAPSGTTLELAEELGKIARPQLELPVEQTHGFKDTRGATIAGSQVHSIRLPSYSIAFETIFGLPDERLTIRHDAGAGAEPYVAGTLLAANKVLELTGLVRGMDRLIFTL